MLPTKDFEFSTLLCSIQQRKQVSKLFKSYPFSKPLGVIRLLFILTKYIPQRTLTIRRCIIKDIGFLKYQDSGSKTMIPETKIYNLYTALVKNINN